MKKTSQMSESIELAILLALSGGLMDSYSYILRGGVFANAQTGNMLLLGVYASKGEFSMALRYFWPIISFGIGIAIAQIIRIKQSRNLHWRQTNIIIEFILLLIVGFLPGNLNYMANSFTSMACGIQVQTFRTLYGKSFSTTMCIGNFRSGIHELTEYHYKKDKDYLENSLLYFFVIICFVIGAILGSKLGEIFHLKTILVSTILLLFSFIIMFINKEKRYNNSNK